MDPKSSNANLEGGTQPLHLFVFDGEALTWTLPALIQNDGQKEQTTLSDVLVVPDLWVNLLSLTKVLKNEKVQLGSQGTLISLIIGPKRFYSIENSKTDLEDCWELRLHHRLEMKQQWIVTHTHVCMQFWDTLENKELRLRQDIWELNLPEIHKNVKIEASVWRIVG